MSDDEEIICKGKDLYTHLVNQGYSDFETFDLTPAEEGNVKSFIDFANAHEANSKHNPSDPSEKSKSISCYEYEQLEILLKSKLLFKEEVDIIGSALESFLVLQTTSKWMQYSSTLGGLISLLALNQRGKPILFYVPFGVTFGLAVYSLWNRFKETAEAQKCKKLRAHIDLLQNLCSSVQKVLRFLRETEMLMGSKIKINVDTVERNAAANKANPEPCWETQPQLRKCLLDSLNEVIEILTCACNVLKQTGLSQEKLDRPVDCYSESEKFIARTDSDQCVSLKELQTLNETYLALQSEYLKLISFCICPQLLNISSNMNEKTVEVYNLCDGLDSKFSGICFRLSMQYNVNNIFLPSSRSASMQYFNLNHRSNEPGLNSLQVEVHNTFLLMLSMLLRVRNVEEYLENIPSNEMVENQNEIKETISKQLSTLKDDLASTLKCFDLINQQAFCGEKHHEIQFSPEKEKEDAITSSNIKRTGVVVGTSDFNVNSPDEVFLAISGLCTEEQEPYIDDWLNEKKPQIPINLLTELSDRLKSRRKYFCEREKAALERQGLLDFPEKEKSLNNYDGKTDRLLDASDSSDDEESGNGMKMPYKKISQNKKYYINVESDDSSTDDTSFKDINLTTGHVLDVNQQSLANLAAMKSQLWRNVSEECFSDGYANALLESYQIQSKLPSLLH